MACACYRFTEEINVVDTRLLKVGRKRRGGCLLFLRCIFEEILFFLLLESGGLQLAVDPRTNST